MAAAVQESRIPSPFRWLRTGQEGMDAMLEAIGSASRSVRLETYTFDSSPVGIGFLQALTAACARGVQVRVLVDAIGSVTLPDSFWEPLRAAGGQVRWFNPITLNRITYRDHRKILVVDDRLAVIGGFNIASEYYGDGVSQGWRDLGLEVCGKMAVDLGASVEAMFNQADFRHKRLHRLRRGGTVSAAVERDWQLLLSGPGRGHQIIKRTLAADLSRAREALIVSAYFVPTWRIRRELKRVARRGGLVRLVLAGKSDVAIAQLACRRVYQSLLRAGVKIYEYQPQILHAKLFIVNETVYAGSANLDARGLGINYELLARVQDSALAAEGRQMVAEMLDHCRPIRLHEWSKSRGLFQKLLEALSFLLLARLDPYLARWQWRKWWRKGL
jgi:cardiolipin synthase A/B